MTKKITVFLILINFFSFAQVKKIQIVSEESLLPIEGVEIYDGNFQIDKSNSDGVFQINISKYNTIYLIKDGFKDQYINLSKIDSKIILGLNKPIELKEVVITRLNDHEILDSIKANLSKNKDFYLIPPYFKMTNLL
jgi:hypothetical protein